MEAGALSHFRLSGIEGVGEVGGAKEPGHDPVATSARR